MKPRAVAQQLLLCGDLRRDLPVTIGGSGGSTPTSPLQCHQRTVRETVGVEPMRLPHLKGFEKLAVLRGGYDFGRISEREAVRFIERYEWLGYAGNALIRYGIWRALDLYGVTLFSTLPFFVWRNLDPEVRDRVVGLQRGACCLDAGPHAGSLLTGACLRDLRRRGYVAVVAYSDERAGERGVVYRASNARPAGATTSKITYTLIDGKWYSPAGLYRSLGFREPPEGAETGGAPLFQVASKSKGEAVHVAEEA